LIDLTAHIYWPEGYVHKKDARGRELSLENGWAVGVSQLTSPKKEEMEVRFFLLYLVGWVG
jgi:hypothetical protein